MKRILISILISFALLTIFITVLAGLEYSEAVSEETSHNLAKPIRLPIYLYVDILGFEPPFNEEEDDLTLSDFMPVVYAIIFNLLMYAAIIYLIIWLINKFRGNQETVRYDDPPEPPEFN